MQPPHADFDLPEVRAEQQAHLDGFAGREAWLKRLSDWAHSASDGGYCLLLGPPGQGKSALLSRFAATAGPGCVLHLTNSHRNPRRFLQFLIWQAEQLVGGQPSASVGPGDIDTLRHELLRSLEKVRDRHGRAIMVIDALDALDAGPARLQFLPEGLPAGVLAVLSARPEMPLVASLQMRLRKLETLALAPLQLDDVRLVMEQQLGHPVLLAMVDSAALLSHTGGNPLFLRLALRRIQEAYKGGTLPMLDVQRFPSTADAVFEDLYLDLTEKAARPGSEGGRRKGQLLHVLAEAREPATVPMLRGVVQAWGTNITLEETRELVLSLSPCLLSFDGERFLLFHEGFIDYLRNKVLGEDGVAAVHRAWATWLGAARQERLPYRLRHLPAHLAAWWRGSDEVQALDLLTTLLTDFDFLQAKVDSGLTYDIISDYGRVLPHLRSDSPPDRPPHVPVPSSAPQIARLRATVQAPTGSQPPRYPDTAALPQDLFPEGPVTLPATSPSAVLLETFASFVSTHSHLLAAGVEKAIVLARNHASGGALATRAQILVDGLERPWVSRDPRPPPYPLPPVCRATLKGHAGAVLGVTATPDMSRIVTCGHDSTARLWDGRSGACLGTLRGHEGEVNRAALCNNTVLTAGNDGSVRVWDSTDGTLRHVLAGHEDHVVDVAMDQVGRLAMSAAWDETLRVWDVSSGRLLRVLQGHSGAVFAVALTPDGRLAVSAGEDGSLRVWDVADGTCLRVLEGHDDRITSVAISSDGTLALSAGYDQSVRLWSLSHAACLRILTGHTSAVTDVAATPGLRMALSASLDRTLRVWDVASGRQSRLLDDHTDAVSAAWLSPDGSGAVSGGWDAIRVWNLATGLSPERLPCHDAVVSRVAMSGDGQHVVSGSHDQTLRLWHAGHCTHVLSGHSRQVWSAAWTGNGRVASAGGDGEVRVWSSVDGTCASVLKGADGPVFDVRSTPDGSLVCSTGTDGQVRVWDGDRGASIGGHTGWVYRLVVWPDATRMASASRDGTLAVWDLRTRDCLHRLRGHQSQVRCLALAPDARALVSGSDDGTVRVWDTRTGACLFTLSGHTGAVSAVLVTPDRRRVVSAAADGTVRIWDAASGMQLPALVHGAPVMDVAVTRDGQSILSAGEDGLVRVWDLAAGSAVAAYPAGAALRVLSAVHPDGRFVCGTVNGQVQFLCLERFSLRTPLATAVRLYRHADAAFDTGYSMVCLWCGARSGVPDSVPLVTADSRSAGPLLGVVLDDFTDPALTLQCQACGNTLRLNAFVVDSTG